MVVLDNLAEHGNFASISPGLIISLASLSPEEVSHALAMMHANEIQHRDVKPENVRCCRIAGLHTTHSNAIKSKDHGIIKFFLKSLACMRAQKLRSTIFKT
eukprot:1263213-Amphidinium_carterae.1